MERPRQFISELKRRRVLNSLMIWGIVAFAVLQVYEPVMHGLHLPEWTLSFVVVALAFGFPITATLSWLFDIKLSGIETTRPALEAGGGSSADSRLQGIRLLLVLVGLGAAVAIPGLVYFFAWHGATGRSAEAAGADPAAKGMPSIAVLPFADMSPQKDQQYLADGFAEEMLNALAQVEGLHVTGRIAPVSFKGMSEDPRAIGQMLKVDAVLTGSVRREGKRIRICTALVNVANGYQLWSKVFERDLLAVFAAEEEIAREAAEAIQVRLLPGRAPLTERKTSPEVFRRAVVKQD
jgi:TolB-like protein